MRLWYCLGLSLLAVASAVATPEPPTALTICASGDSVTLRWSPSQGAVGYKVLFAETLDGPISVLCETTDTEAVDSLLQAKRFYYVVATVPNTPPVIAPIPDQQLVEDSLQVSPINLRNYITDESPFDGLSIVIIQPAKLTLGLEDSVLSVLSLAADSNGLDSAVVHVTDPEGGAAERTIRYIIAERTDLRLFVWDFDRQAINIAKVRITAGTDSTDYTTTNGSVTLQVLPTDSVTVRAWRNTPSQSYDTLSSYIRRQRISAAADKVDTIQVETFDRLAENQTNPVEFAIFVCEARCVTVLIGGQPHYLLGGMDPGQASEDTMWIGRRSLFGDTITLEQAEFIEQTAQGVLSHLPVSCRYRTYISTFEDVEPLDNPNGPPTRTGLQLYYRHWPQCTASLFPIGEVAAKDRTLAYLYGGLDMWCLRQEMLTCMVTVNPAPYGLDGRSVLSELGATEYLTELDDKIIAVWSSFPPGVEFLDVYDLPDWH